MSEQRIGVGIVGCGTVGSAVADLILQEQAGIAERHNVKLDLVKIYTRNPQGEKSKHLYDTYPDIFTIFLNEVLDDPSIDVVVETMGGRDFPYYYVVRKAVEAGKHVVSANKLLLAYHGEELFELAQERGVHIGYEASVAGAIPIIEVLQKHLVGRQVSSITGILNGTSNYILTQMEKGNRTFGDVLQQAQEKGYAEKNPKEDIEGLDVRNKLVILARLVFGFNFSLDEVYVQGIGDIMTEDFEYANQKLNSTIKLIAHCSQEGGIFVCPMIIPRDHFLANVPSVLNAISIFGKNFGELGLIGLGAGGRPTATSVIADIVKIADRQYIPASNSGAELVKFEDLIFSHTLRFLVKDCVGILKDITTILAEEGISIKAVEQNEYPNSRSNNLPFLITLNPTREKKIQRALEKLNRLPYIVKPVVVFRSFS